MAVMLLEKRKIPCSNLGMVPKFQIYVENWKGLVLKIASTFKMHVQSLCKNTRGPCNVHLTISPYCGMVRTRD